MEKDFLADLIVVKRSGQRVEFNDTKIALAIKKGFDSVYEDYDEKEVNKVKEKVISHIEKNYKDRKTIGVEDIQDIIEKELQDLKFDDVYNSTITPTAFKHSSLTSQTTNKDSNYAFPIRAIRLNNTAGTGTSTITILQGLR